MNLENLSKEQLEEMVRQMNLPESNNVTEMNREQLMDTIKQHSGEFGEKIQQAMPGRQSEGEGERKEL